MGLLGGGCKHANSAKWIKKLGTSPVGKHFQRICKHVLLLELGWHRLEGRKIIKNEEISRGADSSLRNGTKRSSNLAFSTMECK